MTKANPNRTGLATVNYTANNIANSAQNGTDTGTVYFDASALAQTHAEQKRTNPADSDSRLTIISPSVVAYDFWKFVYIVPKNPEKPPFWKFDGLYLDGIMQLLESLGFRKRKTDGKTGTENNQPYILIHVDGAIIEPVEIGHIMNQFRTRYINPLMEPDAQKIEFEHRGTSCTEYPLLLSETFVKQQHNVFNEKTLLLNLTAHDVPELKDEKGTAHFYFSNGIVRATKNGLERFVYTSITDACIWRGRLVPHAYHGDDEPGGLFETFIRNVSRADLKPQRFDAFQSAIGYLLHNYNSSAMGQAVIAYDESPARSNEPAGGTGKGLFANGLKAMRNTAKLDGKAIKDDDRFKWQEVSQQTQIVWLDDPKTSFNFNSLFSNLTDGWNIEYKREHKIYIPPADSPKVFIATNTAITNAGSSNKRRQFIIEFSDHYSRRIINGNEEPIKNEHGRVFFSTNPNDNWTAKDWQQYFTFMLNCAVYYLKSGLTTYEHVNVKRNQLVIQTSEDFAEWIEAEELSVDGHRYNKADLFARFRTAYLGEDSKMAQRTFTDWLKKWASIYGYNVEQHKSDGAGYVSFTRKTAG